MTLISRHRNNQNTAIADWPVIYTTFNVADSDIASWCRCAWYRSGVALLKSSWVCTISHVSIRHGLPLDVARKSNLNKLKQLLLHGVGKLLHAIVAGAMKIGNIVPRVGIEPISLTFWASVLLFHYIGSLMSPLYPGLPVYAAPCLRGQYRLLHYITLCR